MERRKTVDFGIETEQFPKAFGARIAQFGFKGSRDIFAKKCYNDKVLMIEDLCIRDVILCTFRKENFAETDLYKDLLEYQSVYNVKYVDERIEEK